jgi:hypothetical protein
VPQTALVGGHQSTTLCGQGKEFKQKRAIEEDTLKASDIVFNVKGIPIVYTIPLLSLMDDNWPDVIKNAGKDQQRWAQISRVPTREGSTAGVLEMFYKAVVQSVLLFGSEPWVLRSKMLSKLKAFNKQIAKRLTGRAPVYLRRDEQWEYSSLGDAMEEAGLFPISEYIARRKTIICGDTPSVWDM